MGDKYAEVEGRGGKAGRLERLRSRRIAEVMCKRGEGAAQGALKNQDKNRGK